MKIWTIMPVKPLVRAKSRLADVLSPEQREKFALNMLLRHIQLLKSIPAIDGILVISRDTKVLSVAREQGVNTVQESGQPKLNTALTRATDLLRAWHVEATLVLPTDIPLLAVEDVEQILHLGRYTGTVVVAPDAQRNGTNALLMNPPGIIEYSYGEGSFDRHVSRAELAGVKLHIYESERIAMDVDTSEDLEQYLILAEKYGEPILDYGLLVEDPDPLT